VIVFKCLWEKTGLKRIMERFAKESNCEFDLVSTIFALVLNRPIDPMSKLSTYDWIKKEIYLHGVEQDIELHHPYRSLPACRQTGKIERVFRELKSHFEIQPIYHYVPRRIKARIFLCFLTLLLEWEFTKRLKEMEPDIFPHQVIKDLLTVRPACGRQG